MAREQLLTADQNLVIQEILQFVRKRYRSQMRLADDLGLSQQTVSRILNGKPVGISAATKIAEHTGLLDLGALMAHQLDKASLIKEAAAQKIERFPRYEYANRVIEALVTRGYDPLQARRIVTELTFDEGARGSDEFALFALARARLDSERLPFIARPGYRELTDDDDKKW